MRRWTLLLTLALLSPLSHARARSDVEIYDRHDGRVLPLYRHDGRLYVAGEPGHEYEIRVSNRSEHRVLAVTSVDGVNVISGQTASPDQGGYVLAPYDSMSVAGWRKSMDRIATFYFTSLPDSYAARTGRPDDVGVIGVALFHEREQRRYWPWGAQKEERDESGRNDAPSAPSAGSAAGDVAAESQAAKPSQRLGTGHGRGEDAPTEYTSFERASDTPDEVITIWYDSRRNLVAQGVIPQPRRYAQRRPQPFPGRFVPDP
ncbi:MAG TPA: hypothetical protein VM074_01230 [Solimonas sp.]|nr:hypothetical protein [Solimonas sp.]